MLQEITARDFVDKVEEAQWIVVVKFGADWCSPCRIVDEILSNDLLQKRYPNTPFYKVDNEKPTNRSTPDSIRMKRAANLWNSIPVTVFFRNGERVGEIHGSFDVDYFHEKMTALLDLSNWDKV